MCHSLYNWKHVNKIVNYSNNRDKQSEISSICTSKNHLNTVYNQQKLISTKFAILTLIMRYKI